MSDETTELSEMREDDLQEENDRLREELARCRWILKQLPIEVLIAFHKLWDVTAPEVRKKT